MFPTTPHVPVLGMEADVHDSPIYIRYILILFSVALITYATYA